MSSGRLRIPKFGKNNTLLILAGIRKKYLLSVGILNQDFIASCCLGILSSFDSYACKIVSDSVMTLICVKTFYCLQFILLFVLLLAVFVVIHAQINCSVMRI
jgi:hypothetical protein